MKYRKCVSVYYFLLFLIKTAVIRLTRNWSEISVSFDSVCDTFSSKNITKFKQPTTKREQQRKKEKKKKKQRIFIIANRAEWEAIRSLDFRHGFERCYSLCCFHFQFFVLFVSPSSRNTRQRKKRAQLYIYIYTHRQIE